MTPHDIAQVAGKLTGAQRKGLLKIEAGRRYRYSTIYGSTRCGLFMLGLLHCVATDTMEATPLGLAVREYLKEHPNG